MFPYSHDLRLKFNISIALTTTTVAATRSLEQDFPSRKPSASLSAHSPVLNNGEAYYHSNCNCNCLKYDDDEDSML